VKRINTTAVLGDKGADAHAYVISANIHRRHLTAAQKIDLVEKLIKANPEMSSRRAAKLAGVSPTTATKSRQKLEQSGDVSTVDTSIDTKGRKQPAKKKRRDADDFRRDMEARKAAPAPEAPTSAPRSGGTSIGTAPEQHGGHGLTPKIISHLTDLVARLKRARADLSPHEQQILFVHLRQAIDRNERAAS
jgi:hypothetical protein